MDIRSIFWCGIRTGSTSFHPYSINPDLFTPLSINPSIISSRHLAVYIKGMFCHNEVNKLIPRLVVIVSYQVPRAAEAWPWPAKYGQMIKLLIYPYFIERLKSG